MAAASLTRTSQHIAVALLALAMLTAAGVQVIGTASTRAFLGFSFPGLPETAGETLAILVNNVRLLAGVLLAAVFAQFATGHSEARCHNLVALIALVVCDSLIVLSAAAHAIVVGAGLGAYGSEMAIALLPHAPLELAAYALALGALAVAHRRRLTVRQQLGVALAAAMLLVLGAGLETRLFVP